MPGCGDSMISSTIPGRVTLGFSVAALSVSFEKLAIAAASVLYTSKTVSSFPESAAQVTELERCALGFRAHMRGDQDAQPCAVDISDVVHVQDDFLFSFGDQTLQFHT